MVPANTITVNEISEVVLSGGAEALPLSRLGPAHIGSFLEGK